MALTGEEFRERVGRYNTIRDTNDEIKIEFEEFKRFDDVKKRLRVLARCSAEDKLVMICGIKQKGGLVAMTGDSIADAKALLKADVGLAMGSGCDVAKENSDLVILDNNFASIQKAIRWGRSIYDNVRKFLQF